MPSQVQFFWIRALKVPPNGFLGMSLSVNAPAKLPRLETRPATTSANQLAANERVFLSSMQIPRLSGALLFDETPAFKSHFNLRAILQKRRSIKFYIGDGETDKQILNGTSKS